jgi:hypothetical protein
VKKTCTLLALVLLASCSEDAPKPTPPVEPPKPAPVAVKPAPTKPSMAPPLSEAQKKALEAAFADARALAKQADQAKTEGERIEKAQGRDAANATLVKAKDLYHKAVEMVSDWTDGDLAGKITDAQVKDYLSNYVTEVGKWQKAISDIGKVHKD